MYKVNSADLGNNKVVAFMHQECKLNLCASKISMWHKHYYIHINLGHAEPSPTFANSVYPDELASELIWICTICHSVC